MASCAATKQPPGGCAIFQDNQLATSTWATIESLITSPPSPDYQRCPDRLIALEAQMKRVFAMQIDLLVAFDKVMSKSNNIQEESESLKVAINKLSVDVANWTKPSLMQFRRKWATADS